MKRGSSTRLMLAPRTSGTVSVVMACLPGLCADRRAGPHGLGGVADGGDDVLIARTATEVSLDRVADLVVGRIGVARQQVDRGHDHARGAEAALQSVLLPEGRLHRVELIAVGKALDGLDLRAVGLDGEHRARLDRPAIDVDGAGAALAGVAADVGAGQVEILPQRLDEESPGLDVELVGCAIDDERDVLAHGHVPPAARAVAKQALRCLVGALRASPAAAVPRGGKGVDGGTAGQRNQVGSVPGSGPRDGRRSTRPRAALRLLTARGSSAWARVSGGASTRRPASPRRSSLRIATSHDRSARDDAVASPTRAGP